MHYSEGNLNRADHLRSNESEINSLLKHPDTRYIPVWRDKLLIGSSKNSAQKCLLDLPIEHSAAETDEPYFFLGLNQRNALFTKSLSDLNEDAIAGFVERAKQYHPNAIDLAFADLRAIGPTLNAQDGALLVYAKGLVHWQDNCKFCSRCGASLRSHNAGHVKMCSDDSCHYQTFPRTDPAVIMLVTQAASENHPARCLLGRSSAWPKGVFSTLAGFVETGESLEAAVTREVFEEVGIEIDNVRYVASQPWPFPRSIMLGFESNAKTSDINIDPIEIEDARWFTRDQLLQFGTWGDDKFELQLPRQDSIARMLVERWIAANA